MQTPYTAKAKKAVDFAAKMSKSMKHNYIGTEHLLLGLLKEETGVAAQVLQENGVGLEKVMELIEELIAPEQPILTMEAKEYSPRAERVLAASAREAARFHSEKIGTEHILIALLRDGEHLALRIRSSSRKNRGSRPGDPDLKQKNEEQPMPDRRTRCRKNSDRRRYRTAYRYRYGAGYRVTQTPCIIGSFWNRCRFQVSWRI